MMVAMVGGGARAGGKTHRETAGTHGQAGRQVDGIYLDEEKLLHCQRDDSCGIPIHNPFGDGFWCCFRASTFGRLLL